MMNTSIAKWGKKIINKSKQHHNQIKTKNE